MSRMHAVSSSTCRSRRSVLCRRRKYVKPQWHTPLVHIAGKCTCDGYSTYQPNNILATYPALSDARHTVAAARIRAHSAQFPIYDLSSGRSSHQQGRRLRGHSEDSPCASQTRLRRKQARSLSDLVTRVERRAGPIHESLRARSSPDPSAIRCRGLGSQFLRRRDLEA